MSEDNNEHIDISDSDKLKISNIIHRQTNNIQSNNDIFPGNSDKRSERTKARISHIQQVSHIHRHTNHVNNIPVMEDMPDFLDKNNTAVDGNGKRVSFSVDDKDESNNIKSKRISQIRDSESTFHSGISAGAPRTDDSVNSYRRNSSMESSDSATTWEGGVKPNKKHRKKGWKKMLSMASMRRSTSSEATSASTSERLADRISEGTSTSVSTAHAHFSESLEAVVGPIKRRTSRWSPKIIGGNHQQQSQSMHHLAQGRNNLAKSLPPKSERNNATNRRPSQIADTRKSMSNRRDNVDAKQLTMGLDIESAAFLDWMTQAKCEEWLKSLKRRDPRYCIKEFFDDIARDGADNIEEVNAFQPELLSPLLSMFQRSSVFSVWRPTSVDSIRKMMTGQGTGKGLDIKGKSAKKGKLSAYVPFLQIHEDEHKTKIRTLPRDGRIRIFYKKREARDKAHAILSDVMTDMMEQVAEAVMRLEKSERVTSRRSQCSSQPPPEVQAAVTGDESASVQSAGGYSVESVKFILSSFQSIRSIKTLDGEEEEQLRIVSEWDMESPTIIKIDDYEPACFGLDMPKRLFWEGYTMRAGDITRPPGSVYDTGRPSRASFQDMNFASIKDEEDWEEDTPRAVVWQYTDPYLPPNEPDPDPMMPQTLLMAYEEHGRVMPVVSDFDCFLLGTRGVRFRTPLPEEQVGLVHKMLDDIESILQDCKEGKSHNWTASWLDYMKKKSSRTSMMTPKAKAAVAMPKYGFGDPKSYAIMKFAVQRLEDFGAVRHGAECFNFYFPQELDDEFLVIGGNLGGAKYKYMKLKELQDFLSGCIDLGFTFPLNPKWVLCDDQGWKALWDKLTGSCHPNVQLSINAWYPPGSELRERIEEISKKYPQGFQSDLSGRKKGTQAWDEAEIALDRYQRIQRAKRKLWVVLCWISVVQQSQKKVNARRESGQTSSANVENEIQEATLAQNGEALSAQDEADIQTTSKRVSFEDHSAEMRRLSVASQLTEGSHDNNEDNTTDSSSKNEEEAPPVIKMGKPTPVRTKSKSEIVRARTLEDQRPPVFNDRFRKSSSSLGSDQVEENIEVIDSLLFGDLSLTAQQTSGLQRIREQLASGSSSGSQSQTPNKINHRYERRHTSIDGRLKSLMIEDVPQFILKEYGGVKSSDVKLSLKDQVHRIMSANRVIGAMKSSFSEKDSQNGNSHFLPVEWTSMSNETKHRLAEMLSFDALSKWEYNITEVAKLCKGSPLLLVGWAVLGSPLSQQAMAYDLELDTDTTTSGYNFATEFNFQMPILCSFLRTVEAAYLPNPYHNSTHAADVVQTLNTMLQLGGKEYAPSPLELFSILVAAVIHDVCHPGLNNNFQINSHSEMAVQYNDVSVLENYSITWFFSKLLGETREFTVDIFCGLTKEQFAKARTIIIRSVLETDMTHHFALLKKMGIHQQMLAGKDPEAWYQTYTNDGVNHDPSLDMLCFLLHQADISNPAKPYPLFYEWADAILDESWRQGDKETSLSLPVSFLCDRMTTDKVSRSWIL